MAPPLQRPRVVIKTVLRTYAALLRAAARLLPPEAAMIDMVMGFGRTQLLAVAARFRLADRLDAGPRTADDLARDLEVNAEALHRMLRAMVSFGVFAIDDQGRFRNNRLSSALKTGAPGAARDAADYFGSKSNVHAWADLDGCV